MGLPIAWCVTPADVNDIAGARKLLGGLTHYVRSRLRKIWADATQRGKEVADGRRDRGCSGRLSVYHTPYEPGELIAVIDAWKPHPGQRVSQQVRRQGVE